MSQYRICKNKCGWYKIQLLHYSKFFFIKDKWKDSAFEVSSFERVNNICTKWKTKEEAQNQINYFLKKEQENNSEWTCNV